MWEYNAEYKYYELVLVQGKLNIRITVNLYHFNSCVRLYLGEYLVIKEVVGSTEEEYVKKTALEIGARYLRDRASYWNKVSEIVERFLKESSNE